MSRIIKAFIGRHIDLTKIISISDARFIDNMGSGGWFVGFDIDCQLLDKPIPYVRRLEEGVEYVFDGSHKAILTSGELVPSRLLTEEKAAQTVAVARLQYQINGLVAQWREAAEGGNLG